MRSACCALRQFHLAFFLLPLAFCLLPSFVSAADVTLAWDANSESDLAGYVLHYGTSSGNYTSNIDVGNTTQYTITGLQSGVTYYFAATAYDNNNLESTYSQELAYTVVVDSDGDGVPDNLDAFPLDPAETLDTDGDGVGNNADLDDDNDGMPDEWELAYGLNPLQDDASGDLDGDGISNIDEYNLGTAPNHYEGNLSPNPPVLLMPDNGAVVGLTPRLETDQFDDPNANDSHGKTRWQISRTFDGVVVFDVTTSNSLTAIVIPSLILEEDTEYEWQVMFIDNHDSGSNWSDVGYFTTEFNGLDSNANGIRDDQETDPTLDMDEDGIPDIQQDDIKNVIVEGGSNQIGISIRDAAGVQTIEALESEGLADLQSYASSVGQPANLPYGLISFRLLVDQPGAEVVITLHLSDPAPAGSTWLKFDPVEEVWYDYSAYTAFSADRKKSYLTLQDGGFGDADGIANGIIVDPLGLTASSDTAAASDTGAGGGSGAGCFIVASSDSMMKDGPLDNRQKSAEFALSLMLLLAAALIITRRLKKLTVCRSADTKPQRCKSLRASESRRLRVKS